MQPILAEITGIDRMRQAGAQPGERQAIEPRPYTVADGVARLSMVGPILRGLPAWLADYGVQWCDPDQLAEAIAAADADPAVTSITITCDSPGGTIGGVIKAADALAQASKPSLVRISGLCASAAYWIASQADRIESADATAEVGSIGVYTLLIDASAAYAAEGLAVHLISSGGIKGHGAGQVNISAELIAAQRGLIDDIATLFRAAVGRGRGLSDEAVLALADGRTWLADRAAGLRLIDSPTADHQEPPVDLHRLNALAAAHPAQAARILALAAEGRSPDEVEATVQAELAAAAEAAQAAAQAAKLEAIEAELADLREQLAAERASAEALKTEAAELKAQLANKPEHDDPGHGEGDGSITRAQFEAMTPSDRAAYIRKYGSAAVI